MEEFDCGVRVLAGPGAIRALEKWRGGRFFVVTDSVKRADAVRKEVGGDRWEIFAPERPRPAAELVSAGVARVRAAGADVILGLGDGDAVDLAKAMAYFAGDAGLAAVPTLSGTGAAVTGRVTLVHGEQYRVLENGRLRPEMTILDGRLPEEREAEGGFEAVCRAIEGFCARDAGAFERCLARESFGTVVGTLPRSAEGVEVRQRTLTAAAMGAVAARNTGGLCSALTEVLHRMFHVSRGRLCAVVLPAVMELNAYAPGDVYGELARLTGLGGSGPVLRQRLVRLGRELKLPEDLARAGVAPERLRERSGEILEGVLASAQLRQNPMRVEDFMVRRLLEQILGR